MHMNHQNAGSKTWKATFLLSNSTHSTTLLQGYCKPQLKVKDQHNIWRICNQSKQAPFFFFETACSSILSRSNFWNAILYQTTQRQMTSYLEKTPLYNSSDPRTSCVELIKNKRHTYCYRDAGDHSSYPASFLLYMPTKSLCQTTFGGRKCGLGCLHRFELLGIKPGLQGWRSTW